MDKEKDEKSLPVQTLEAVAKSMFHQTREYGFQRSDYVRFVNILLDLAFAEPGEYRPPITKTDKQNTFLEVNENDSIRLRMYEDSDFPLLDEWVSDEKGRFFLLTRSGHRQETLKELIKSEHSVFSIVLLNEKAIGALAYLNIDKEHGRGELRKLIGDRQVRGKGYALKATRAWIEYGVTNLGLRKISLDTLDTNLANIMLNEQLGFRVEGLLREECMIDDKYKDVLRMSLIVPR